MPLFHMDFYRLEHDDLSSIDLNAYLEEPGLVVIEWPQLIMNDLPDSHLQLKIERVDDSWDSTKRVVNFEPHGKRNDTWVKEIIEEFNK